MASLWAGRRRVVGTFRRFQRPARGPRAIPVEHSRRGLQLRVQVALGSLCQTVATREDTEQNKFYLVFFFQ